MPFSAAAGQDLSPTDYSPKLITDYFPPPPLRPWCGGTKELTRRVGNPEFVRVAMNTKTIKSQTLEFPTDRSLVVKLLDQLIRQDSPRAWVHLERIKQQSRMRRGVTQEYQPSVDIMLNDDRSLGVNAPTINPDHLIAVWSAKTRQWQVSLADREKLVNWIVEHSEIATEETFCLAGWIEGL
jgi:hypothetical protein